MRTRAPVVDILIEKDAVAGVRLKNGTEERCPRVFSDIGVRNTLTQLMPATVRDSEWAQDIMALRPSACHIGMYLGFNGDIRSRGATSSNHWFYESIDIADGIWRDPAHRLSAPALYVTFPSLKQAGVHISSEKPIAELVTFADWEVFSRWENSQLGQRPADYLALKETLSGLLRAQFGRYFPALAPLVVHSELSTPLSSLAFTVAEHGGMYGPGSEPAPVSLDPSAREDASDRPLSHRTGCGQPGDHGRDDGRNTVGRRSRADSVHKDWLAIATGSHRERQFRSIGDEPTHSGRNVEILGRNVGCIVSKQLIVAALGERALALPRLIGEGLAANDRFKYRLTLLQSARRHADAPEATVASLRAERIAARIDDVTLDGLPLACKRVAPGEYRLPGVKAVLADMGQDVRAMLAPILTADGADGTPVDTVRGRAEKMLPHLQQHDDAFSSSDLDEMSHAERARGDSLHLLVMDLHRMLNGLQQHVATEVLDGASVYDLAPADRDFVRAFMRGVNRSARLKFDHPGLGTTATSSGGQLLIQNDIGTTDAHVLVVHVTPDAVSVTYTDVHLQRLVFFQRLFRRQAIAWQDTRVVEDRKMEDGWYHVASGRFASTDRAELAAFLEFLGSRLVFLIDWNRARKQLRMLVGRKEAVRLLEWTVDRDAGHMGFLKVGGAQAVFDALDFAARGRFHFGQTLDDLLGVERAGRFLEFVLKTSAGELLANRHESLVHDELRAEVMRQLRDSSDRVFDLLCDHAGLIVEIANAVRDALLGLGSGGGQERAETLAARSKAWETAADRLVNEVRNAVRADPEMAYLLDLVHAADDVADDLEETSFVVTLLRRGGVGAALVAELSRLAGQLVAGCQELIKALETVRSMRPRATREDLKDFLEAVYRIECAEHETDQLRRRISAELAGRATSATEIHLAAQSAAKLERAGDHLQHVALILRDRVLAQMSVH